MDTSYSRSNLKFVSRVFITINEGERGISKNPTLGRMGSTKARYYPPTTLSPPTTALRRQNASINSWNRPLLVIFATMNKSSINLESPLAPLLSIYIYIHMNYISSFPFHLPPSPSFSPIDCPRYPDFSTYSSLSPHYWIIT